MRRVLEAAVVLGLMVSCTRSSHRAAPVTTSAVSSTTGSTAAPPSSSATTTATTTTTAPALGPDRCQTSTVRLGLVDTRAAAGHGLAIFEVRNTSARPCRASGYPEVELLDASGQVLAQGQPRPGSIVGGNPPSPVTIAAGAVAYFGVESETICPEDQPPTVSERARVTLPDDPAPAMVVATISVCPQPHIVVSPLRRSQAEITRA